MWGVGGSGLQETCVCRNVRRTSNWLVEQEPGQLVEDVCLNTVL